MISLHLGALQIWSHENYSIWEFQLANEIEFLKDVHGKKKRGLKIDAKVN